MEISTMVVSGPKSWKFSELCGKRFYALAKIKEVITLLQLLNSRKNSSVPKIAKHKTFV